jgi:hypothetical protein
MSDTLGKRPSPLSIRLSAEERNELEALAGGEPLSTYVKRRLFDHDGQRKSANPALLAQLLATLGRSHVAGNLERLTRDAEFGILVADKETVRTLRDACDDIRLMHNALMRGLGLREKAKSRHELGLRRTFEQASRAAEEEATPRQIGSGAAFSPNPNGGGQS